VASIIRMPGAATDQITQRDLAEYRLLAKEFYEARLLLRVKREEIAVKLRADASVEDGIREAELRRIGRGGKTVERLVVRW
jgi:hypothetical protein